MILSDLNDESELDFYEQEEKYKNKLYNEQILVNKEGESFNPLGGKRKNFHN
jgi:hypothetical protein